MNGDDYERARAELDSLRNRLADELIEESDAMHETHSSSFRQGILWASLHIRVRTPDE